MIAADAWRPAAGLELEPNALEAARETTRSLALTAGPGAGKTEMLAQRADFLLRTGACPYPRRILAISFKVDAAKNLKERVRLRCGRDLASRLDSQTFHAFAKRLIDRFRPALTGADALDPDYTIGRTRITRRQIDFSDLVPLAIQILENNASARNAIRQTYSHVFLDEFQDCTGQQYQLVRAAFQGTGALLTAVGDTKQKIMGFAGAMEGVFRTFVADFAARPLNLYQNFRADPRLRRMQNEMVKVMDANAAIPDDQLVGDVGIVEVLRFPTATEEAAELARRIHFWIQNGDFVPSEIAVLVRLQPDLHAKELVDQLRTLGVPIRNEQALQDLASEPAARLVIDYLSVIFCDREPDAYERLMEFLMQDNLDEEGAARTWSQWQSHMQAARDSIVMGGATIAAATALANEFIASIGRERLAALSHDYTQGARLEEVMGQALDRFQELAATEGIAAALKRFADDSAVRVMTIHKSKGLEFEVVFVLGVEMEAFFGALSESRPAFFVAISRAKHRLYLTAVERRPRPVGAGPRWDVLRREQAEFIGYAEAVM